MCEQWFGSCKMLWWMQSVYTTLETASIWRVTYVDSVPRLLEQNNRIIKYWCLSRLQSCDREAAVTWEGGAESCRPLHMHWVSDETELLMRCISERMESVDCWNASYPACVIYQHLFQTYSRSLWYKQGLWTLYIIANYATDYLKITL